MYHLAFQKVLDIFGDGQAGNRQEAATQVVLFVTDGFPSAEVDPSIALAETIRASGATIITVQVAEALGFAVSDSDSVWRLFGSIWRL
jgi:hypothetical protein